MNRIRRNKLHAIYDRLQILQEELEDLLEEEEEARDNIPESFAERWVEAVETCSTLEEAIDNISDAADLLLEAAEA